MDLASLRQFVYGWSFVLAALLCTAATLIAFVVTGDLTAPTVIKFACLAFACVIALLFYEEVAHRV